MAKKQAKPDEPTEAPAAAPAEAPAAEAKKPRAPRGKDPRKDEAKANPDAPAEAPSAPAAAAAPKAQQGMSGEASKRRKGQQPGQPPKRGKKLREQLRNIYKRASKEGPAPLKKAVGLLKQLKRAKFDETVEIHMSLGIDATQSDQMIRGSVALPHGVGKAVRVLVFCQGDNVGKAKDAGADFAGSDELIKKIQGEGWLEFDVALATQDMMGQVSRLGKVLGPRGLMPTPKAGTVITSGQDVAAAVREFKAGKVEYRSDKGGNVHAGVGKMSFDDDKLVANVTTFVEQIRSVKPSAVKGHYVRSITLAGTMTPGIPVTM
jgi:large subunit ribosomal protein L1